MKICIASGTYHPDIGGPPTYLFSLAAELVARGHALKVITYGQPGGDYPYPVHRVPREGLEPVRLARFALATLREAQGADLLYVNDYGLPPAGANVLLRRPLVIKVVGDFAWEYAIRHGLIGREVSIDEFQQRRFGRRVEQLRVLQTWYVRQADRVITPSRYLTEIVAGWGVARERLRLIYNAPTPRTGRADRALVRGKLGFGPNHFVVATLARLAPWKGVDVLISALAEARRQAPRLCLLVIGDGDERTRLERLAAPLDGAVQFAGELPREAALAALDAADALGLCSAYEGLSHVILEAMEAAKPILATAVGGNLELLCDGENGLLVPYGDVGSTGQALVRLATEPQLAVRLASQARRDAESRSWPGLVEATLAVFDEAIAVRRGFTR